jgi:hypothetical protein
MSWLANKSNDELLGYLNNDDGTGLSEAAKQELARRGALPGWSSEPANVAADMEASATPIAMEPEIRSAAPQRPGLERPGSDPAGLGPASPQLQEQWDSSEAHAREAGRIIRSGLHPQTPVDPGTPEQQARWNQFLEDNPDEMQRYRPQEFAAREAAKQAESDKAHAAMLEQKYGPGTGAKWLAAREQGRGVGTDVIPVHKPTDQEIAERNAADARYTQNVSRPRWAREAGLSQDVATEKNEDGTGPKMSDNDLRLAAANQRQADKQARELQWRATVMMRAGNYAGALALPGLDPAMQSAILNQQNAALNANRPGGPLNFGPTPLGVEAMHNQQLTDLGLRVAQGRGFQQVTPEQAALAAQQADTQLRQTNPSAAGVKDIADGRWDSEQGIGEIDRLRDSMDNDWGGFSYESEQRLARRLQEPPYNMKPAEAEAAAWASANRERWWFNQTSEPARPRPVTVKPAAPAAGANPGTPPPARPGRPKYVPMDS